MKTFAIVLAAAGTLLAGCVAYPDQYGAYGPGQGGDSTYSASPYRGTYHGDGNADSSGRIYRDRDGRAYTRDADRDGRPYGTQYRDGDVRRNLGAHHPIEQPRQF